MTDNNIKLTIAEFGFTETKSNVFSKLFKSHNYLIEVDFNKNKIDYGKLIRKGDETTSNLSNDENIVVLECVSRLLEKGYNPKDLHLEKRWKLGHTGKGGKADVSVKGKDGKSLIIIECKTYGKEFKGELEKMKNDGGQLFSYLQQDKNTKFLCLYSSRLGKKGIETEQAIIKVEDTAEEKVKQQERPDEYLTFEKAKTIKEMLAVWKNKTDKEFQTTGIFENEIEPYNPGFIPLRIENLKEFSKDDKGKTFNEFEEILRHNNISDRSNAFNRIISLILAKIVDENKADNEIADFQIKHGIDSSEDILERLQSLYSKAMKDYLKEDVIDYTIKDIENEINSFPKQSAQENLLRIYRELKFYSNNEFAFKEIYNEKLFNENAKVLEEIIRLFQPYKFKYNKKAQFLGDFFELMLETGYKQSEGQFFTPTPIAKFIISSIPLNHIIDSKIVNEEKRFLPTVIDFACGSGHFLTEAIEEIQELIQKIDTKFDDKVEGLKHYRNNTIWAGEYIYGVEKDYRLARTTQVACFMHGDGDANIIFGDGLEKQERLLKDGSYDVLIANPPYTIKDFKKHLNVQPRDFELWDSLTIDSDDIEVLFIERMKQLLAVGGMAGIILPSSILSNSGTYTKARELILKHFEIIAITEFGSITFGATGTNTVTLFLKKRNEDFAKDCGYIADDYILNQNEREHDFINSEKLFKNYIALLKLDFEEYKSFANRNPSAELKKTDFFKNYQSWFDDLTLVKNHKKKKTFKDLTSDEQKAQLKSMFYDFVLEIERDKFYHYLLTHKLKSEQISETQTKKSFVLQETLIIKSGSDNASQKAFLGYTFSERRGYKGISLRPENKMYDKENQMNSQKVNSYIYKAFLNEPISEIHNDLKEYIKQVNLVDCINFKKIDFDKRFNLSIERVTDYSKIWGTDKLQLLKDIAVIQKGTSITKEKVTEGNIPVVAGGKEPAYYHNVHNREENVITISASGAYAGFVNYWNEKIFASDCNTVTSEDEKKISTKLIFEFLKSIQQEIYYLQRGQAQPHVYGNDIEKIQLPIIPKSIQQKIEKEINTIEKNEQKTFGEIKKLNTEISQLFNSIKGAKTPLKSITTKIGSGATPKGGEASYKTEGINLIRSQNVYDHGMEKDGLAFIDEEQAEKLKNVIVETNDILFNITGASVCRCCIVEKEYLPARVNQHVSIIRTNKAVNHEFLHQILISKEVKSELLLIAKGATSREAVTKQQLEDFEINLPPIAEQNELVKELNKLQKKIAKLEQSISNTEIEKKEILKKYLED